MTLPVQQGVSAAGSETSVPFPVGHASGHFGLLVVEAAGGTVATPAGFTLLAVCANTASATKIFIFGRFATSGAESNAALSGGTNNMWGVIVTYSGVNTSTPVHGVAQQSRGSSVNQILVGTTTFLDDCVIFHAIGWAVDNAGPLMSGGATNGDLGSPTVRSDSGTLTNNGGGVIVVDGTLATHGSCRPTSITLGSASALAVVTLALQAADKTLPTLANKSRAVNTGM